MLEIPYSVRVRLGIALIVVVVLTSGLRQLKSTLSSVRVSPRLDDISQYEQRFAELRHSLPSNLFVSYSDEFATVSKQCNAFVLAQYSLAPTVLAAVDSECGRVNSGGGVSPRASRFVLYNSHDPRLDPYLLRLFPNTYFEPYNTFSFTGNQLTRADQLVLIKDFGHGVRLYARADK